jgi:hypothetical protein
VKAVLDEGGTSATDPASDEGWMAVQPFPREWKGLKNGKLLDRLVSEGFECLVTCDRNIRYQQNLGALRPAIVVLPGQTLDELAARVADIAATIAEARPGFLLEMPRASFRSQS